MNGIKNILFDMGGVLVDLNRHACIEAYENLGFNDVSEYLGDYGQKGEFLQLEEGSISSEIFFEKIRTHIPEASDAEITAAFCKFLVDMPLYKLEMLRKLKEKGYRLLLLSNTNPLLFPYICETYFTRQGLTISDYFTDLFLSYEIGAIKPDPKAFEAVIAGSGINPEETLFIDDSQENLDVAITFGFETYLAPQNSDFSSIFNM
ncbi:MAG: HAD family phosphatase [Bacteroidales bacterium]